jgi:hypothetical protein
MIYRRLPRRPPFLLVLSVGMGVTSSILPIRMPALANARSADWAPGPGVFEPFPSGQPHSNRWLWNIPPVARILM